MSNFWRGKKVFIAGGAGLLGQALCRKLVPLGAKVTATEWRNRKIDEEFRSQINVIENFDFLTETYDELLNVYDDQEIVFWAAAKVGGARAIRENPSELIHYNLEMTARNIKTAVDAGVERLGFIGSSYSYPDFNRPNIEGDDMLGEPPLIHYGLGWVKRYLETLCRHHQMTSHTKFGIIRPVAYFGPHDDFNLETCHVVPALIRKAMEQQNPFEVWGDGSEVRSFTYVDDIAEGLMEVVTNHPVSDPINICLDKQYTVYDIIKMIFKILDFYPEIIWCKDRATAIPYKVSSPAKAKRLLGFECKTSLIDGLRYTIEWFRNQNTISQQNQD